MPKTFDQYLAESGRQSELDQLRASGGYDAAKAQYEGGQGQSATTPAFSFSSAGMVGSAPATQSYGGDLDKLLRESGRQSELDQIRAIPGGFEKAQAEFQAGRGPYSSSTSMGALTPQPTLNLPDLYKGLFQSSGIEGLEKKYSDMEKKFIDAKGDINDNPFLSEASRVGREAKITKLFDERTANIRGEIATKKADVETQLNLQMKQFDINSQVAQQAFNQAISLLQVGALDNAGGESIAQLTRSTGIPSDVWYSAIAESKKSKEKQVSTSVITSTAENGEMFAIVLNSNTGEIVKKTSLGVIGNVQGSGDGATTTSVQSQFLTETETLEGKDMNGQWFGQFPQLVIKYAPTMSLEKIYSLYLQSSLGQLYGSPTEDRKEMAELYDYARSGKEPED